ncbi:hypothetical protein N656DRAFT_376217 [Canariomyces notabilis]|uniref:Uncharacterized protein n=1 Tax=Canariomyces notabilis TaxID=2074819 RepID=A0AAN6T875_9PEZI|nr:hypothetical protein N656DRAFT_376217 [Canariomyces arenarius]
MGRPADEDLPEVATFPPRSEYSTLPEVVPDTSPEAGQPPLQYQHDKFAAYYDDAPKLPNEEPSPGAGVGTMQSQEGVGSALGAMSPDTSVPWQSIDQHTTQNEKQEEPRICGIRRRIFIILCVVVVLIIVAVGVGAGIGASRARGGEESESDAAATSTTTSIAPAETVEFLNNQSIGLGQAFQGWEGFNFTGRNTPILREEGFHDLEIPIVSYIWTPNGTDYCITMCYNKTHRAGWRCRPRRQREAENQGFKRIYIWTNIAANDGASSRCS